jgi:hypothetical protein
MIRTFTKVSIGAFALSVLFVADAIAQFFGNGVPSGVAPAIDNTRYLIGYLAIAVLILIIVIIVLGVILLRQRKHRGPTLKVFLSYRRADSQGESGRIADRLEKDLGIGSRFFDVDSIPPETNFFGQLAEAVAKCDVLIAVVGPRWLDTPDDKGGRRLDSPEDTVRVEIATALHRSIPVIPILLDGTPFPRKADLPSNLQALTDRQGLGVRHTAFHPDVDRLVEELKKVPLR